MKRKHTATKGENSQNEEDILNAAREKDQILSYTVRR